jgi:hypothetical protein
VEGMKRGLRMTARIMRVFGADRHEGLRCPVVYSASEINNWHIAEEFEAGKWRPARCCGFGGLRHWRQHLLITWRVFTGRYDALNWGDGSGEAPSTERRYKDCTEPEFFSATRVYEPK